MNTPPTLEHTQPTPLANQRKEIGKGQLCVYFKDDRRLVSCRLLCGCTDGKAEQGEQPFPSARPGIKGASGKRVWGACSVGSFTALASRDPFTGHARNGSWQIWHAPYHTSHSSSSSPVGPPPPLIFFLFGSMHWWFIMYVLLLKVQQHKCKTSPCRQCCVLVFPIQTITTWPVWLRQKWFHLSIITVICLTVLPCMRGGSLFQGQPEPTVPSLSVPETWRTGTANHQSSAQPWTGWTSIFQTFMCV